MAGTIRAVRLQPREWVLLAEKKTAFLVVMRTIGAVLIQRADAMPVAAPDPDADSNDEAFHFATVHSGQPRSGSYNDAKNIYAFNPGNDEVVVEFEVQ